jgi:hypothetical protein
MAGAISMREARSKRPAAVTFSGRLTAEVWGYFALVVSVLVEPALAASRLHCERNFLRSLPLRPFSSACFEHSREAALRSGLALAGAALVAGAAGAGVAAVCAKAEVASISETTVAAIAREEIVIMERPHVAEARSVDLSG